MGTSCHNVHVGVGVFVVKDGKVLFGKRLGAHGTGTWCPPGGHLEFGESFEECARREVQEETGLEVANVTYLTATNDIFEKDNKHYITIMMRADWVSGEPQIIEADKMVEWQWCTWEDRPKNTFLTMKNLAKSGFTI